MRERQGGRGGTYGGFQILAFQFIFAWAGEEATERGMASCELGGRHQAINQEASLAGENADRTSTLTDQEERGGHHGLPAGADP